MQAAKTFKAEADNAASAQQAAAKAAEEKRLADQRALDEDRLHAMQEQIAAEEARLKALQATEGVPESVKPKPQGEELYEPYRPSPTITLPS